MLKLPKLCLKPYNLQNTAANIIIIKRLLHLRCSCREVFPRLTFSRISRTFHRKTSIDKVDTVEKVI